MKLVLAPGEKSPFIVDVVDHIKEIHDYEIEVEYAPNGDPYVGLEVIDTHINDERRYYDCYHVLGDIVNNGESQVRTQVFVTLYGDDGRVVQVGDGVTVPSILRPLGEGEFSITLDTSAVPHVASYAVTVQAADVLPEGYEA